MFKKIKAIIAIILVIGIGVVGVLAYQKYNAKVDTEVIKQILEESSELTTAKLTLQGSKQFKDRGVKIFNRGDFILLYEATVQAGIDLSEIKIDNNEKNKKVTISIPKAEILSVSINPDKNKFIGEKFAVFNFDKKEDASRAQSEALKDAKKQAAKSGVLELADKQSAKLIEGLIGKAVPDTYELEIVVEK
jgi:hypothetical protein